MKTKISWLKDSKSAFEVLVEGSGILQEPPLQTGTIVYGGFTTISPNGLWAVTSGDDAGWELYTQAWRLPNGGGGVFYKGAAAQQPPQAPFLAFMTFHNWTAGPRISTSGNTAHSGDNTWIGHMKFEVIKVIPEDPYTWLWWCRYSGKGPALP